MKKNKEIKIIETLCRSKTGNEQQCEDGIYTGEHFIAVIDGVTGSGDCIWPQGQTGGCFAKNTLIKAMEELPYHLEAEDAILFLNQKLKESINICHGASLEELWSLPQAAVILYSRNKNEIWSFGDCQCMIDQTLYRHDKEIDTITAKVRCLVNTMELKSGNTEEGLRFRDKGREFIIPLLKKQRIFANAEGEYAYDILNGADIHAQRVVVHKVPEEADIVLASDGYPFLKRTLQESEQALQDVLVDDPLCMKLIHATKGVMKDHISFDDRAYIRFHVG